MQVDDINFLLTEAGQELLAWASKQKMSEFSLAEKLRKQTTSAHGAAITEMLRLREKAKKKFERAADMLFTAPSLEQASAEIISKYRADKIKKYGIKKIADLCCGIGGDAVSLAEQMQVVGVDFDQSRLDIASHNLKANGREENFTTVCENVLSVDIAALEVDAIFIDPARRDEAGKRKHAAMEWMPPLSDVLKIIEKQPNAVIKAAPGISLYDIPDAAEAEFISVNGELRECVLWFGSLQSGFERTATVLPLGESLSGWSEEREISEVQKFLYLPDPAVVRAELVDVLAEKMSVCGISEETDCLTAEELIETPFAKVFAVEEVLPFNRKELKRHLKKAKITHADLIGRATMVNIEKLHKELHLKGGGQYTIIITRCDENNIAIICKKIP